MINKNAIKNKAMLIIAFISVLLMLPVDATAEHKDYTTGDIQSAMQDIIGWKKTDMGTSKSDSLLSADFIASAGSASTDWYVIALGRMDSSQENLSSYRAMLERYVEQKYQTADKLDAKKATEWHRISLAILATGGEPTAVGDDEIDLIADGTYNRGLSEPLDSQGINGLMWGLITLDSMKYDVPDNACDTREDMLNRLISKQNADGSFSLTGSSPDIDLTAMALTALSPYLESDKQVQSCVNSGVAFLSEAQQKDGSFGDKNGCEAVAQTLIALCSLDIDPVNDARFIKNGNDLLDGLMSYRNADGGFLHQMSDKTSSSISSEQSLLALISLYRFQNGMNSLYDFSDEGNMATGETNLLFNENDMRRFEALPSELTTKDYNEVLYLYDKLSNAKNKYDYADILSALKKKKAEIETICTKIEDINAEILEMLYPFDSVTLPDRETVERIYKETQKLSAYDRKQVLGYEDLLKTRTMLINKKRNRLIMIIAFAVFIVLGIMIILSIRKRRLKSHERNMPANDNDDW